MKVKRLEEESDRVPRSSGEGEEMGDTSSKDGLANVCV